METSTIDDGVVARYLEGRNLWRDVTPQQLAVEPAEPVPVFVTLDRLREAVAHTAEFVNGARIDAKIEQALDAWRASWTDVDGVKLYTPEAEAEKRRKLAASFKTTEELSFKLFDTTAAEAAGTLHRMARAASELPSHTMTLPAGATIADRLAAQQLELAEDAQTRAYQHELTCADVLAYYQTHTARRSGNVTFLRLIESGWIPPLDGTVEDTLRAQTLQREVLAQRARRTPSYVRQHIATFQQLLNQAGTARLWVDLAAAGELKQPLG